MWTRILLPTVLHHKSDLGLGFLLYEMTLAVPCFRVIVRIKWKHLCCWTLDSGERCTNEDLYYPKSLLLKEDKWGQASRWSPSGQEIRSEMVPLIGTKSQESYCLVSGQLFGTACGGQSSYCFFPVQSSDRWAQKLLPGSPSERNAVDSWQFTPEPVNRNSPTLHCAWNTLNLA